MSWVELSHGVWRRADPDLADLTMSEHPRASGDLADGLLFLSHAWQVATLPTQELEDTVDTEIVDGLPASEHSVGTEIADGLCSLGDAEGGLTAAFCSCESAPSAELPSLPGLVALEQDRLARDRFERAVSAFWASCHMSACANGLALLRMPVSRRRHKSQKAPLTRRLPTGFPALL